MEDIALQLAGPTDATVESSSANIASISSAPTPKRSNFLRQSSKMSSSSSIASRSSFNSGVANAAYIVPSYQSLVVLTGYETDDLDLNIDTNEGKKPSWNWNSYVKKSRASLFRIIFFSKDFFKIIFSFVSYLFSPFPLQFLN